jgi:hypothetical protein
LSFPSQSPSRLAGGEVMVVQDREETDFAEDGYHHKGDVEEREIATQFSTCTISTASTW